MIMDSDDDDDVGGVSLKLTCVGCSAHMPELAEDEAAFVVNRRHYTPPRRHLLLRPNARRMREPSVTQSIQSLKIRT